MERTQLFKGNCIELMKNIANESIDLVVTDPPYKLVSGGCTTKGCIATTDITKQPASVSKKQRKRGNKHGIYGRDSERRSGRNEVF